MVGATRPNLAGPLVPGGGDKFPAKELAAANFAATVLNAFLALWGSRRAIPEMGAHLTHFAK